MYNTGRPHCENGYPALIDHAHAVIARQLAQGTPSDFPTAAQDRATTRQRIGATPVIELNDQILTMGRRKK
jgi:hypothetical protein